MAVSFIVSQSDATAVALADGYANGQIKILTLTVDGGNTATITPTTFLNGSTIAFNDAGDSATLVYNTSQGWVLLSQNGATIA